jgi:hypothetical protein
MRKLILMAFLLISFCRVAYTQSPNNPVLPFIDEQSEAIVNNAESENSWDGAIVNPIGQFRVLNILINIIYDVTPALDPHQSLNDPWPRATQAGINIPGTIPTWAEDSSLFDVHYNTETAINGTFTRKFHESSFGALHMTGDFVVINIPQSYIIAGNPNPLPNGQFEFDTLLVKSIRYLNSNQGGLQTLFGFNSIHDYELNANDTIYFASIVTRNTFHTDNTVYGYYNDNNGTVISFDDEILFSDGNHYPVRVSLLQCVGSGRHLVENPVAAIYHEFGHCLFGSNNMHSSGGNGWSGNSGRTFLPRMGGYGLMGMSGSGMVSANGFDRWWLHWKSPVYNTSNSYIAASNQPSDITQTDGTKNFILRDFVTTGDAIRIKLPFVDEGAKNQYIWLENHKIGANNKLDFLTPSSPLQCRPNGKPGIYAFYQVGKDVLTGTHTEIRPSGQSDHLRLISAEGNFNYIKKYDVVLNCFVNATTENGHGRQLDANPFMGCNDAMIQFYHASANELKIDKLGTYVFLLDAKDKFINGQWVRNDSMPYLMDERDPFTGTRSFNLSSNPSPVNTITFYNTNTADGIISPNTNFGLINNDSIFLTGLNIVMNPLANGDYKVTIDWNHNRLDNSVAWTGKIALPGSLYVYDDDTLLLKQNNTPCRIFRDPFTQQFAPFTVFDCRPNSTLTLSNTSRMIASDKSKIYVQARSILTLQNSAKLIVKSGCELIIEDCGNLVIRDNAQLVIEEGGIITIKSGDNVFIDGEANIILQPGYATGTDGISLTGNLSEIFEVPPIKQITSNTTWTGKTYKFFDDLYISPGATLNLTGTTLKFFRNAKVKVARGAKLNMEDNSILTTTCGDELWQGVEVWGDPNISQSPTTNQGHVVMNNSTIEFARTGVLLDRPMPTDGPGIPSGNGGGIIQADNSTFSNNYIGVSFSGYATFDNISAFNNCLFTANTTFPLNNKEIDSHCNLNSITGLDFKKCIFKVSNDGLGSVIKVNYGIRSHNSNFLVDGLPLNGKYQRSVFENLKYGVYVTTSLSLRNFTVRNSVFKNNNTGVFASGVNNARISENLIIQPLKLDDNKFTMFGIYLEYCDKYTIQQDSLWGVDFWQGENKDRSEAGILIKNSGPAENLVYNNLIRGFQGGVIAEGENRSQFGTGLCVKCNVFFQNLTDIHAIPFSGVPLLNQGIRANQGSNAPEITAPGGNIFTNKLLNPSSININNEFAQPINYFYHTNTNGFYLIPPANGVIIDLVTVFRNQGTSLQFDRNDACPPKLVLNDSKEQLIAQGNTLKSEITIKESELSSLIDDSNTQLMVNNVVSSAPFEALWLHDALLSTSPFLSDTVLIEAGKREEVLNSAMIRDIMVANPHSAKSSEVMSALDQRVEPIPDDLMAEIEAGKNQIGAKQELEISISDLSYELAFSKSRLLDSFYEENDYDSIRWVLHQFPEPLSEYHNAWTWFDEGDTGNGLTAIQNINLIDIPVHHRNNQTGYIEMAVVLNNLANDTSYVLLSDSVVVEALFTLASSDNPAGVTARNLLFSYRLLEFNPIVSLPDTALKTIRIETASKSKTEKEGLHVFPNPANDFIIIDYELVMVGKLRLISQDGRICYSQNLNAGKNQLMIRLNNFSPGIYIASIAQGRKVLSAKFTVK